jgi:D-isomer specific 2-hydroxyacid dehydrogenase, catalytic domain
LIRARFFHFSRHPLCLPLVPGRILVTPRSVTRGGHSPLQRFRDAGYQLVFCRPGRQLDEAELLALLPGCVSYLAGVEPVTARVLESAPGLRVISRNGTGVDAIDVFEPEPPTDRRLIAHTSADSPGKASIAS